jgi:hypothetical protein
LFDKKVFKLVPKKDLPKEFGPIPAKMVYKRKFDGYRNWQRNKARFTTCGNFFVRQDSTFSLYSPTIGYEIFLLSFALIALIGLYVESLGVSGAYLLN